ncbi:MAG: type I-U CRISPR-associated protein Csx17, partial [Thermoplasmata archaeon]
IRLEGCRPVPLAFYLKALGVLRLVSEQKDPQARGYWDKDVFVLKTKLTKDELIKFFLEEYRPTPIVTPWNGGSGFYPKDNKEAIKKISDSKSSRLKEYKIIIQKCHDILHQLKISKKPVKKTKEELLGYLRLKLDENVVLWLDASFILSHDGIKYPPLLGTGGNDGRLEFVNNFMQRICEVIDVNSGGPCADSHELLLNALFDHPTDKLITRAPIGQYSPSAAGGANTTTGFDSDPLINPWNYILLLEGTLLFAGASVRRYGVSNIRSFSYPFSVKPIGAGYCSASEKDGQEKRPEIWIPIWENPVKLNELNYLLSEGRGQVGKRPANNSLDFVRAITTLGIDRGITKFVRYGFQVRNGRAYFSIPFNYYYVSYNPTTELLMDIDSWLDRFVRASSKDKTPASIVRVAHQLEESIFRQCTHKGQPSYVLETLVSLGACEKALGISNKWTSDNKIQPISGLSSGWLKASYDGTAEFRLAAALASVYGIYENKDGEKMYVPLRENLEPVSSALGRNGVSWHTDSGEVVWHEGDPYRVLIDILLRRLLKAVASKHQSYPDRAKVPAMLQDVLDFTEGKIDVRRMTDILWGLVLLDWKEVRAEDIPWQLQGDYVFPGASYALLKLCFAGHSLGKEKEDVEIPMVPDIVRKASAGRLFEALQLARRRLTGSGFYPVEIQYETTPEASKRIAASLLFPIDKKSAEYLLKCVVKKHVMEED